MYFHFIALSIALPIYFTPLFFLICLIQCNNKCSKHGKYANYSLSDNKLNNNCDQSNSLKIYLCLQALKCLHVWIFYNLLFSLCFVYSLKLLNIVMLSCSILHQLVLSGKLSHWQIIPVFTICPSFI